jgi:hypothetical protein
MSYLNSFENFFSNPASSQLQTLSPIPKFELPTPVLITDEPTKTSTNKVYSNPLDYDFIIPPFKEPLEKNSEEESENEDDDIYQVAPEYPSDVDHRKEWDGESDSTLPVNVYTSPDKRFPRFSKVAGTYPILSRNESHSSNMSDITITSAVPNEESHGWSVRQVATWKDSLFSNELRSRFELIEDPKPCERLHERSTVSKTSTRSSLRDVGPDNRSREEIFSKGVPWGFHGRDYIPPLLKSHKLCETMRRLPVERNHRFATKAKKIFRRWKE